MIAQGSRVRLRQGYGGPAEASIWIHPSEGGQPTVCSQAGFVVSDPDSSATCVLAIGSATLCISERYDVLNLSHQMLWLHHISWPDCVQPWQTYPLSNIYNYLQS